MRVFAFRRRRPKALCCHMIESHDFDKSCATGSALPACFFAMVVRITAMAVPAARGGRFKVRAVRFNRDVEVCADVA
jgi:hypothetical protein